MRMRLNVRPAVSGTETCRAVPSRLTDSLHLESRSPHYQRALAQLRRFAVVDAVPVLLEGETGTGKTFFARHLHALSRRAAKPWAHVNLAALEDGLANSDLFGHISGAFTGANQRRTGFFAGTDGGTLFLDEVGQASIAIQRKLLHADEYGEIWPMGADRPLRVDVRVVAASNRPLADLVRADLVLHDLQPRLAAFCIRIPPLRDRREDIVALAEGIVARDARLFGGTDAVPLIHSALAARLRAAPWPGNVRQLEGAMRRALVEAQGSRMLLVEHFEEDMDIAPPAPTISTIPLSREPSAVEGLSKAETARRMGVSRATLYRRLARCADKKSLPDDMRQDGWRVAPLSVQF